MDKINAAVFLYIGNSYETLHSPRLNMFITVHDKVIFIQAQYTTSVLCEIDIIEQIHHQFKSCIARLFAKSHKPNI